MRYFLFFLLIFSIFNIFFTDSSMALVCGENWDCLEYEFCGNFNEMGTGECIKKFPDGQECVDNIQCQSKICDLGADNIKKCISPTTTPGATIKDWKPTAPKLEVDIPTLQPFTTAGMEKPDAEGNIYIPFIGQYIVGIYKWALLVAGIIATVMIILGGFTYLTSGGDATRAGAGKERIGAAIFGLILLLGSYLMLYLLNPDLVQFKSLKINVIKRMELEDLVGNLNEDLTQEELQQLASIYQVSVEKGKVPIFKQYSSPWATVQFGGCGNIHHFGCGPTALAMVLRYYGEEDKCEKCKNITPLNTAKLWADLNYRRCNQPPCGNEQTNCQGWGNYGQGGMLNDKKFLENFQLNSTGLGKDQSKILNLISQGKPVIASMGGPSPFTKTSHYVVLVGLKQGPEGTRVIINDPGRSFICENASYPPKSQAQCSGNKFIPEKDGIPVNLVFQYLKGATLLEPK